MKENYNKTDGYRESIQMGLKGLKTVGKNITSESELNKEKIEFLKKEIENLEIIEVDERFSTVIADNILKDLNKNGAIEKRKVVDKVAASIILQTYLDMKK